MSTASGLAGRSFKDIHNGVEMQWRHRHIFSLRGAMSACRYGGLPLTEDLSLKVEDLWVPSESYLRDNIGEALLTYQVRC